MKAKQYKLKPGTTTEDILALKPGDGISFIHKNSKWFLSKCACMTKKKDGFSFEIDMCVGFPEDLSEWNDYNYVIVLDEDFGQPYHPFYKRFGEDVTGFPALEWCIKQYNEFMDSIPVLIEVKEQIK